MQTILEQIIDNKRREVQSLKQQFSIASYSEQPLFSKKTRSLRQSVLATDFGIIAEIKRKSPSGGDILPNLNPIEIAQYYQQNKVSGISILTDFDYFGGSIEDLKTVRSAVEIPLLRKEFIIDEIQLFEAKAAGADAILLIAAVLGKQEAHHLTIVAQSLGLEVLFEVHAIEELEKINDEVDLIAVNNRDLHAQQTSLNHSFNLAPYLPSFAPTISASGITNYEEIELLKAAGFKGALIGESVLRTGNLETLTGKKIPVQ